MAARPVSSFYGGGDRHSQDALRNNRDSYLGTASNRGSVMMGGSFPPGAAPDARYSQAYSSLGQDDLPGSPYGQAHAQDARPDLYADFNGIGPRYVSRLSSADMYANDLPYASSPRAMETQTSLLEKGSSKRHSMAAGELMDAPELGKDWAGEESRKSRVITEKTGFLANSQNAVGNLRKRARKAFAWKRFIFVFFAFLICLGILLYFCIPRVPGFQLSADEPLTAQDGGNANFTRTPTYMAFDAQLNVAIDAQSNWLPLTFSSLDVTVYALDSYRMVGSGRIHGGRKTFPGRAVTPTSLEIEFSYRGKDVSDPTWLAFYQACAHKFTGTTRPGLDLIFELDMCIKGIIGKKATATTVSGLECPIELPANNA